VSLDDSFFRRESARLVAALARAFGIHHLALIEDAVQETLARAYESWSFSGVPAHHSALLMTSARNRLLDAFRHERTVRTLAPELQHRAIEAAEPEVSGEELFLPAALRDDELRMMFSCCHPRLPEDVQVALILSLLCGFGVGEIAGAFLLTEAAVAKRLSRGKTALSGSRRLFELEARDFGARLEVVHRALYLLFSEGYHGAGERGVIRSELCTEALRLVRLLVERVSNATPATHALAALMCLHAARLPGRRDGGGELLDLFSQDRSSWDPVLIDEGLFHLERSARGATVTRYHLEAAIAGHHALASSAGQTRWTEILYLYDELLRLEPSPVVALNRAVALAQVQGPQAGLEALRAIPDADRLSSYPFYPAALGEMELRLGHLETAAAHFTRARELARNADERSFLIRRIAQCSEMGVVASPKQ